MKTAAIYARVSTASQAREGSSLSSQLEGCHDYAQRHDYTVVKEVAEDVSGATLNRPGLDEIRDLAEAAQISAVICLEPDRLSRDLAHTMLLTREFERRQTSLLFVNMPKESGPTGDLMFNIKAVFAEFERSQILERTRRGKHKRAREGRILGTGKRPFGYQYIKGHGRYEIDEEEAKWVRQIFKWLNAEGLSMYQVAQRLTHAGVTTTTGKIRWAASSVHSIVSNTTYTGVFYWNKRKWKQATNGSTPRPSDEWIAIPCPAIISQSDFDLAQVRLQRNKELAQRNCKNQYLLRGLVRCELCGYGLVGHLSKSTAYYYCNGSLSRPQYDPTCRCSLKYIRADRLEKRVWDKLMERISNPLLIQKAFEETQQLTEQDRRRDDETLVSIHISEEELKREINMLLDLHRDGDIDRETFRERMAVVKKQQQALESSRAEVLARVEQRKQTQSTRDKVAAWCAQVSAGLLETRFEHKRNFLVGMNPRITTDGVNVDFNGMLNLGRFPIADIDPAEQSDIAYNILGHAGARSYRDHY